MEFDFHFLCFLIISNIKNQKKNNKCVLNLNIPHCNFPYKIIIYGNKNNTWAFMLYYIYHLILTATTHVQYNCPYLKIKSSWETCPELLS